MHNPIYIFSNNKCHKTDCLLNDLKVPRWASRNWRWSKMLSANAVLHERNWKPSSEMKRRRKSASATVSTWLQASRHEHDSLDTSEKRTLYEHAIVSIWALDDVDTSILRCQREHAMVSTQARDGVKLLTEARDGVKLSTPAPDGVMLSTQARIGYLKIVEDI